MARFLIILLVLASCNTQTNKVVEEQPATYSEKHRPLIHFSPKANWMNDPNGLVFHNGTYHLFFQYYPDSTVWGPMHWGHATSTDLVHWKEDSIALYPDSLGYIFSGSAVVDKNNTSGLGKDGKIPLVAIFTYHDTIGVNAGRNNYQTQGLAYSNDDGKTWTKYENNPVLSNPGIIDFRDPKVMWYEKENKWIMSLATKDRITFYSSHDLKNWKKESEFGATLGAHGGVWECPDLFPLVHNGDSVWVLFVSINPGGPNGGSATQYFVGDFDGKTFTPFQTDTRWLDYGPDNYAGVTWSNVNDRTLFIGWMSNWQYGQLVPTHPWRSAMTVPRVIGVEKVGERYYLTSTPAKEMYSIMEEGTKLMKTNAEEAGRSKDITALNGPAVFRLAGDTIQNFTITLSNDAGEQLIIGYDEKANQYYIDRSKSGKVDFEKGFGTKHTAPRLSTGKNFNIELVIDNSSVELFADGGLSVLTSIFFPERPYNSVKIQSTEKFNLSSVELGHMKRIWK